MLADARPAPDFNRQPGVAEPPAAEKPRQRFSWWHCLLSVWAAMGRDNISIMAAGTAYYTMLSIFPGMSALVLSYGLVSDPSSMERHLDALSGVLPAEALKLISGQLHTLVNAPKENLSIGLGLSLLLALWSATSGTAAMMQALTVAYEGREERGFLHFYGLAIALTVGLGAFIMMALLLIAGVPAAVTELPMPGVWRQGLPLLRWPILAGLAVVGLGMLYRLAPNRDTAQADFFGAGTIAASLLWLAGSAGFSYYASNFGSYDRTYGSLGAVAILLVWLYVTAYIILIGAELNAAVQRGRRHEPQNSSTGALKT